MEDLDNMINDSKKKIADLNAELAKKPKEVEVIKEVVNEEEVNKWRGKYSDLEGQYKLKS